jgi:2-polyprenyl-3-methyl-5-hydroxy-6-metoxy-1,4-benzoquinol methylase
LEDVYDLRSHKDPLIKEYELFYSKEDPYSFKNIPKIALYGHKLKKKMVNEIIKSHDIKNKVILSIGTGDKPVFKFSNTKIVVYQDISVNALIKAKKLLKNNGVRYFVASNNLFPCISGKVDIIFAGEVIEHVKDAHAFLDECCRVLKPEGVLILTTPNKKAILYRIIGRDFSKDTQHISLLSYDQLKQLILNKGFKIRKAFGINQSFFPILQRLDKYIISQKFILWWVKVFLNKPKFATGVIIECIKI